MEFNIGSGIGIVSQFVVVVEAIVLCAEAQCLMPCHTGLLPFFKPFQFGTGLHEELHLHLFELPHTEDKLACHDLVAESLTNLGDTKRHLHAACLLHIEVVDKDTLCSLGAQIDFVGSV